MKLLALAYYYPPNAGSGTHRSLYFLNRLAACGDDITVITARQQDYAIGTPVDPELSARAHPGIRIVRAPVRRPLYALLRLRGVLLGQGPHIPVPAAKDGSPSTDRSRKRAGLAWIKDAISAALTYPDDHVGWIPGVLRQGSGALRRGCADRIYSSGGPWSSHLAAVLLKRRHRVPLILDFRDPWASNPYGRGSIARMLDRRLEAICIRAADRVVVNTEPLRQDFVRRYPREPPAKFTTITNGFERIVAGEPRPRSDRFILVHAGDIYAPRDPACLLQAAVEIIREGSIRPEELVIRFVGGCSDQPHVVSILDSAELAGVVEIVPRVPHRKAMEYQLEADALLLFQNGFPLQIPRKLFEYLSLLKPVLAIAERGSATAAVMEESGAGVVAGDAVPTVKQALLAMHEAWKRGGRRVEENRIARYRNDNLAMTLRSVIEEPRSFEAAPLARVHRA